jgi:RND family efflux transporter MFP subunit
VGGIALAFVFGRGDSLNASAKRNGASTGSDRTGVEIPVNTVRPRQKTLERILVQPGSVEPVAEAELYAKASGYLKRIQRLVSPELARYLVKDVSSLPVQPVETMPCLLAAFHALVDQSPEKDIGSPVRSGEVLLEISAPERLQEVVEKESLLQQRQAELESARAGLNTFQAAVEAAKAHKVEADADTRKAQFHHTYLSKELGRLKELVDSGSVTPRAYAERENEVQAALANWESSRAKVQTAQAELTLATAKLTAATTDLRVKELLVQVARDSLRQAEILADYSNVRAPFDGIITFRAVDEGDFVQNATSGQARRLMTIAAIDKVKVAIQIPERDTPWVRIGSEATMSLDAFRGGEATGRVARIAHSLDAQTRTMQVEIDMDNRDHKLMPGMYGQVALTLQKIPNAQAIPATALYSRRGESYIILVKDGIAHRQLVRVRYDDGREVEVVKLTDGNELPLDPTDEVIVSNKGEIADGQRVHAIRMDK